MLRRKLDGYTPVSTKDLTDSHDASHFTQKKTSSGTVRHFLIRVLKKKFTFALANNAICEFASDGLCVYGTRGEFHHAHGKFLPRDAMHPRY